MNHVTEQDITHIALSQQHAYGLSLYERARLNSAPISGTSRVPIAKYSYRMSMTVIMVKQLAIAILILVHLSAGYSNCSRSTTYE